MEHFLESLKKLKKPSTHSNPEKVDPLFCRYNKGWNDAIVKVEELITSYNVSDMWIPVSERLPEKHKDVIATTKYDGFMGMYGTWLKTAFIDDYGEWNGECIGGKVIAWMPLPEPYKEKEHE